ncbi:MAG: hypothetical protein KAT32_03565 [Candidatus Moranbacteria bacterium]|nr:hypothetical protein [Candidatus Moranbacteria bacterium]
MKNQKYIIISIVVLILSSVMFLGIVEYRQRTEEANKSWWSTYFVAPYDSDSLNFVIENYDKKNEFSYEVILDDEVVKTDNVVVETGENKLIELDIKKDETKSVEIKINLNGEKKGKSLFKN